MNLSWLSWRRVRSGVATGGKRASIIGTGEASLRHDAVLPSSRNEEFQEAVGRQAILRHWCLTWVCCKRGGEATALASPCSSCQCRHLR